MQIPVQHFGGVAALAEREELVGHSVQQLHLLLLELHGEVGHLPDEVLFLLQSFHCLASLLFFFLGLQLLGLLQDKE